LSVGESDQGVYVHVDYGGVGNVADKPTVKLRKSKVSDNRVVPL